MTDTQTLQRPFFGQQLGETTRETRALLDAILERENTTFERWVAMNTLGTQGPAIAEGVLHRDLAAGLQKDPAAISRLIAELEAEGLVDRSLTQITLTAAGVAHYQRLRHRVLDTSARVLEGIEPDDVQTTLRVLTAVKERARTLQAG